MPPTPKDKPPDAPAPTPREQLSRTASTNPQGVVDRTRVGVVTPGLEFEDGQADHRQDLQEPIGNGAATRDGILVGTTMTPHPDRPDDAGPMWIQEVDEPRGEPVRTPDNIDT